MLTSYDALGRVRTTTNPFFSTSESTYGVTTYGYDATGRPTIQIQPDNSRLQWCYGGISTTGQSNCSGNRTGQVAASWVDSSDESGNDRQESYDALGRLIAVVEPNGGTVAAYTYDALGDLTSVSLEAESRSFHYDGLGRLVSATNPESGTVTYQYPQNSSACSGDPSNVCSRTDARGITTTYAYDALNRLTTKTYSDNTPPAHFNYDETSVTVGSNQHSGPWTINNGKGRLTSQYTGTSEPGLSLKTFSYDAMGRPRQSEQCWGSECSMNYGTRTNERRYDLAGNVIYVDTSANTHLSYTYDNAGNISSLIATFFAGGQSQAYTLITGPTYDPAGQPLNWNNYGEVWTYDNRLRTTGYSAVDVANFSLPQYAYALTFDSVGNVKSAAEQTQNTSWTWQYSYDSLNRLIAATSPELALGCSETYDAYGNRTSQAAYGSGNSCISNSMSFTGNNNRIDMGSYDASGNLLQDPPSVAVRHTYTYDAEGRLSSVDGATAYVYGADGVRVAAISASGTTNYLSDFDGSLLARYVNGSANGQPQEIWVKGQHRAIVSQSGTLASIDITSTLTDWLGNIRVNDDFSGQVRSSFRYLPFGNLITLVPDSETSPLLFTAKQRDQESGNDYFGARYYSSATGRFTSPDWSSDPEPVPYANFQNPQSLNLYAYVHNNPTTNVDNDGHDCGDSNASVSYSANGDVIVNGDCNPQEVPLLSIAVQAQVRTFVQFISNLTKPNTNYLSAPSNTTQTPQPCNRLNAFRLDYSQPIHPGGVTSQDHILQNHTTGMPGKSQYRGNWFGITVINAATYLFGSETIQGTSHVFNFTLPQLLAPLATYDFGTDPTGAHTASNRLVTTGNCTTVVTSYPIP